MRTTRVCISMYSINKRIIPLQYTHKLLLLNIEYMYITHYPYYPYPFSLRGGNIKADFTVPGSNRGLIMPKIGLSCDEVIISKMATTKASKFSKSRMAERSLRKVIQLQSPTSCIYAFIFRKFDLVFEKLLVAAIAVFKQKNIGTLPVLPDGVAR